MCGVCGVLSLSGRPIERRKIEELTDRLAHRGPDGRGVFLSEDRTIALGHRRLSILDTTSSGAQPMWSADGRFVVSYNGEIYNFLEIRDELRQIGANFTSDSDTEVILVAFQKWGDAAFDRFNGMWALAIWDTFEKKLTLCRDRFGVKPLYYLTSPKNFIAFASETLALRKSFPEFTLVDENHLSWAISAPYSLEGRDITIYSNIRAVPAGAILEIFQGRAQNIRHWWRTEENIAEPPTKYVDQVEEFRELFLDSCRIRLRSDVPVGTALSGGVDSSAVFNACQKVLLSSHCSNQRTKPIKRGYTISFPNTSVDELSLASQNACSSGVDLSVIEIEGDILANGILEQARKSDIIYSTPLIMERAYARMRSEGTVVSLDGHGADEIFLGYPEMVDNFHTPEAGLRLEEKSQTREMLRSQAVRFYRKFQYKGRHSKGAPWMLRPLNPLSEDMRTNFLRSRDSCFQEVHRGRLPTLLRNYDYASMQHGVEIRMPFMDYRLVCFGLSLPFTSKYLDGVTKMIVRDAMRGIVPDKILDARKKIGLAAPMAEWLNSTNDTSILDWMSSRQFLTSDIWNGSQIRGFAEARFRNRDWDGHNASRVWRIVSASLALSSAQSDIIAA